MRETQFVGLTASAEEYIQKHAIYIKEETCKHCGNVIKPGRYMCEEIGEVEGMFGEVVYKLRRFIDKETGEQFQEFVQAEPWSSGPMIFLGLEKVNPDGTTTPIQETLWVEDETLNTEYDTLSGKFYV